MELWSWCGHQTRGNWFQLHPWSWIAIPGEGEALWFLHWIQIPSTGQKSRVELVWISILEGRLQPLVLGSNYTQVVQLWIPDHIHWCEVEIWLRDQLVILWLIEQNYICL